MIIALFAIDQCNGMGFDGAMPWPRNREDMQWFKSTTENQVVVMGRKTWDSKDMPIPLPNRLNVLITNNFIENEKIVQIRGDIPTGLEEMQWSYPDLNVFVIGGPNILMQAKPVLKKVFITRIPGEYINDVKINIEEFLEGFKLISIKKLETCEIEEYEAISQST